MKESYSGTLGIRGVEVGKRYRVVNGDWDFKVKSISGDEVVVAHYWNRKAKLSILASETSIPLYIRPLD